MPPHGARLSQDRADEYCRPTPSVCYNTKVNRVVKVLDFVKSGGPDLTVGSTTFELTLAL